MDCPGVAEMSDQKLVNLMDSLKENVLKENSNPNEMKLILIYFSLKSCIHCRKSRWRSPLPSSVAICKWP